MKLKDIIPKEQLNRRSFLKVVGASVCSSGLMVRLFGKPEPKAKPKEIPEAKPLLLEIGGASWIF